MEQFDIIDDLAIEEEGLIHEYLNPIARKVRNVRPRNDNFNLWDDKEFHRRFRLYKESAIELLAMIREKIECKTERYVKSFLYTNIIYRLY